MRNIAPSRALFRRARQFLQLAFFLIAGGVFSALVGIALRAVPLIARENPSFGLYLTLANALLFLGVIIALGGLVLAIRAATWRPDNDLAKITGNALSTYLDDNFTLVRNVNRFGIGYIDAVLVGPPGVLVFRITDRQGIFLNEGDRWLRADRENQWVPARTDLTRECVRDMKALDEYLDKRGMVDTPIFGVVVFIHDDPKVRLTLKDPSIPATHLSALMARLHSTYFAKARIDTETRQRILDVLYPV